MEKKIKKDPENYAKMSIPFENEDEANKALSGFHEELSELRKKYKIPDVLIVIKGSMKLEDGECGDFVNHSHFGSSLNMLSMAAYAFGQLKREQEELISKLAAGKR
jgi:hypothetical protein